jgi:hypothetical protein
MMTPDHPIFNRFRAHLGRECLLRGRSWRLVELLPTEGKLVLESRDDQPPIQPDQYGNATHRAPEHLELSLITQDGEPSSAALGLLDALDQRAA